MATGISAWGSYLPRARLLRSAIADAHQWMAPSLRSLATGRRAYCNWDEDAVTMAVEASRHCLGDRDRGMVRAIQVASTTSPAAILQSSAVAAVALRLDDRVQAIDVGGSHRAGIAALGDGLQSGRDGALIIASDRLRARPASVQEMQYGAGAAAFLLGNGDDVAVELMGRASMTTLFVDHFRAAAASHDYYWEERWIREEGYAKLVGQSVRAALDDAGVSADMVRHFIFAAPLKNAAAPVARAAGIAPETVADPLTDDGGYAGAAHAPMMLANVLDGAGAHEVIVVVGFGQGCDILVLRTTPSITAARPARRTADIIASGRSRNAYAQMAAFYGEIAPDWGMRAERDTKTALTEQYRSSRQIGGFVAGQCRSCAQVQFPQLSYCVNCQASASAMTQVPLADLTARVLTYTADALMYYPSPPLYAGFAQFDNGARLLMEFVDVDPQDFDVGTPLTMCFRIKERDDVRGYCRYFWKAAPAL
ncbi:zinc ribbon domain-containing protein [Sphingobium sp.]|uniref:zinc ribbon domain-containing protein n=1 Tax=Sphingobium sp. TaxID=1912891 RepID=UPI003B3ADAB4